MRSCALLQWHSRVATVVEYSAEDVLLWKARTQAISGPEGAKENSPVLSDSISCFSFSAVDATVDLASARQ